MANTLSAFAVGGASLRDGREQNLDSRFIVLLIFAGVPGVLSGTQVVLFIPDRAGMFALGLLTMGLGIDSFIHRAEVKNITRNTPTGVVFYRAVVCYLLAAC